MQARMAATMLVCFVTVRLHLLSCRYTFKMHLESCLKKHPVVVAYVCKLSLERDKISIPRGLPFICYLEKNGGQPKR